MAINCFNLYKGDWEVSPSLGSQQAYLFWKNVIDEYTSNYYKYIDNKFIFNNK